MILSKRFVLFSLMALSTVIYAQKTAGRLSIRIRGGGNAATVIDKDNRPIVEYYPADGATRKHKESNSFVTLGVNYDFGKGNFFFSPGLWFTGTNVSLYNRDGSYSGHSRYNMSYLQIPLLFKYQASKELATNLTWYVSGGPQIGLKLKESLDTKEGRGDYAHFWSMANYDTNTDPTRGRNGNGGPVALFNPLYVSFMINGGVDYKINDKIAVFGGLTVDLGITNALNPNLLFYNGPPYTYRNPDEVSITDLLKVRHNLVGIDVGIRL